MKNIFFIIISLFYFSYNVAAENTVIKSEKYLTKTLENLVPFKLIKEVGKKITNFGGKEILFGTTAAGILSKGLADNNDFYTKNYFSCLCDCICKLVIWKKT